MLGQARIDIPTGHVPDYRTFVRHVWTYRDTETGRAVFEPPWMYECHFRTTDEWCVIGAVCDAMIRHDDMHSRPRLVGERIGLTRSAHDEWHEIRFADLEALHAFLLHLAGFAAGEDEVARQLGEFLMWTLGFRWV